MPLKMQLHGSQSSPRRSPPEPPALIVTVNERVDFLIKKTVEIRKNIRALTVFTLVQLILITILLLK